MIELKHEYPYIDSEGIGHSNLCRQYAVDENGKHYYIKQNETGVEYAEAVDIRPCRYTYVATDIPVEIGEENGRT